MLVEVAGSLCTRRCLVAGADGGQQRRGRQLFLDGARETGYSVAPPAGRDPRTVPHPLASFVQGLRLTNAPGEMAAVRHEFIYLTGWHGTPFTPHLRAASGALRMAHAHPRHRPRRDE